MNGPLDDLFVFELANNHQGSVEHGLAIVDAASEIARRHKIKAAAKLQIRELESFIHPSVRGRSDVKHVARFESTRLDRGALRQLTAGIRAGELRTIATPFDEPSVVTCLEIGVEVLKIASCSARDWPLLREVAAAGRPVIVSTGGLGLAEIDALVDFLGERVACFALMHCVPLYPTPVDRVSLGFLERMARRYPGVPIGYSGHEAPEDLDVVVAAVAKGARLLERHFGLPTAQAALNAYSLNPLQAERWVTAALRARAICGEDGERRVGADEIESLHELERGAYAARAITRGERLGPADVFYAMPRQAGQVGSGAFGDSAVRIEASRDYADGEPLLERPSIAGDALLRSCLREAKGLVNEAAVPVGEDPVVEVSHHYGIGRLRQTGCVQLRLVNREYCEKLLVLLPGQTHPAHRHRMKEETFRLLWGDLEIELGGNAVLMQPGDLLLIERDVLHGFSSLHGAIVQEISTTDVPGDSFYEDPRIRELAPGQRKTILERW